MVLVLLDLLLEFVKGDLVVLNDKTDLELLDTEANFNPLVGTPDKAIHLDSLDVRQHLLKGGLVICRMVSICGFLGEDQA